MVFQDAVYQQFSLEIDRAIRIEAQVETSFPDI